MINITPTAFHREGKNNFRKKQYLSNGRRFHIMEVCHLLMQAFLIIGSSYVQSLWERTTLMDIPLKKLLVRSS